MPKAKDGEAAKTGGEEKEADDAWMAMTKNRLASKQWEVKLERGQNSVETCRYSCRYPAGDCT